jgi:hypothetical protein
MNWDLIWQLDTLGVRQKDAAMRMRTHADNLTNCDACDAMGRPVTALKVVHNGHKQMINQTHDKVDKSAEILDFKRAKRDLKLINELTRSVKESARDECELLRS